MSRVTITRDKLVVDYLEPGMEVVASGLAEHFRLANRTPEPDCLADLIAEVAAVDRDLARRMRAMLLEVLTLNAEQTRAARDLVGRAERDALALHGERKQRSEWSVKRLAQALRAPLGVLCSPVICGDRHEEAARVVGDVLATAPEATLRSVSLRHELGVAKATRLVALLDARTESVT